MSKRSNEIKKETKLYNIIIDVF